MSFIEQDEDIGVASPSSTRIVHQDCMQYMASRRADSFDLVFYSPPYCGKEARYPDGRKMTLMQWVRWMQGMLTECVRVSRGYVFAVVNNRIKQHAYEPAIECLVAACFDAGLMLDRTQVWNKNATPTRSGVYCTNDYEQVIAIKSTACPYYDYEVLAEPPAYTSGGAFRQRKNAQGGDRGKGGSYPQRELAGVSDVFRITVGGGHMGFDKADDKLATQGKAPMPLALADRFVQMFCPPGGIVFDPCCGSATTGVAAVRCGKSFVGCEISETEIAIARKRLARAKQVQRRRANDRGVEK